MSTKSGNFYVEFTKIDAPNNMNENDEDVKELKAMLDIAKMLSDKSSYFKGRGIQKRIY